MNADNKRFVPVTELTKRLGLKASEAEKAMKIADKAEATMKIGVKIWYDWEKALDYKNTHPDFDREAIKWIQFGANKGGYHRKCDKVRLTINKCDKKSKRLRFAIPKDLIKKKYDPLKDLIMCGTYENMMFFSFSKSDGFALEKDNKSYYAATIKCDDKLELWAGGEYTLHQEDDELYYIVFEEKESTN